MSFKNLEMWAIIGKLIAYYLIGCGIGVLIGIFLFGSS